MKFCTEGKNVSLSVSKVKIVVALSQPQNSMIAHPYW